MPQTLVRMEARYAGSHGQYLYAVRFDDGEQRWAYKTGKAATRSPSDDVNNMPFVAQQRIDVSTKDGWFYVLK